MNATRWYRPALAAIAVLAGAIRVVLITVVRPTCVEDLVARVERGGEPYSPAECGSDTFAIWGDSAYGYLQARLMARGHWFVDGASWFFSDGQAYRDSAGDPPLYAFTLSLFARLGFTSVTSMRLLSAVAGVAAVVLVGMLARRLAGPVAGVVGAGIAAVYPMLWINDGMLLSESLFVPLVLVALVVAYWFWDAPSVARAAGLGVAVGVAGLTRSEGLFLALLLVPLVWGAFERIRERSVALLACWAAVVLVCAPWFAFNLSRFEEPVLMTAQTGSVLSAASCDSTFYGDRLGYWDDCMAWYLETGRVAETPDPAVLDESQVDAVRLEAALDYTRANSTRLPVVVAARVGRMWDVFRPAESVEFNAQLEGRGQGPSVAGLWAYYALVPFAVLGAVTLWRARVPLTPLLAVPAAVTVTAALTFGITRYRAPGDAVLVVLAAVAIAWLVRRDGALGSSTVRRRPHPIEADPHATTLPDVTLPDTVPPEEQGAGTTSS